MATNRRRLMVENPYVGQSVITPEGKGTIRQVDHCDGTCLVDLTAIVKPETPSYRFDELEDAEESGDEWQPPQRSQRTKSDTRLSLDIAPQFFLSTESDEELDDLKWTCTARSSLYEGTKITTCNTINDLLKGHYGCKVPGCLGINPFKEKFPTTRCTGCSLVNTAENRRCGGCNTYLPKRRESRKKCNGCEAMNPQNNSHCHGCGKPYLLI